MKTLFLLLLTASLFADQVVVLKVALPRTSGCPSGYNAVGNFCIPR